MTHAHEVTEPQVADTAWSRARATVMNEVVDTALRLFSTQGFDATTIDQIVRESGVSQRSLFRYFGTKEDIVLGGVAERGERAAALLSGRPPSEDPWQALRAAFRAVDEKSGDDRDRALRVARLITETPALQAAAAAKHQRWQRALVPAMAARLGGADAEFEARAIVAAALACLGTATEAWIAAGGLEDLDALDTFYERAVRAVRR